MTEDEGYIVRTDVNSLLFIVDEYGRLSYKNDILPKVKWFNVKVPEKATDLYYLCYYVTQWISQCETLLMKYDIISNFRNYEIEHYRSIFSTYFVNCMYIKKNVIEMNMCGQFQINNRFKLSHVIMMSMFQNYFFYIASSCNKSGRHISIKDGFIYFSSLDDISQNEAIQILYKLNNQPRLLADWINDIAEEI